MANQNNDLYSMSITERMNTINGDDVHKYTFKEALNRWLKVNKNGYANISLHEYEPHEALAIVQGKSDLHGFTVAELLNEMVDGNSDLHKYSPVEALNKIGTGFGV
tara:strand:+ start:2643 stop:2960 length:318 start_codon:yes stop_codon:yes gene_type:complete